ncbi:MAG: hypothetical protein ABEN55_17680 [Bradymonadaceae bacterium]
MGYRGVSGTAQIAVAVMVMLAGFGCSSKSEADKKKKKKKDLPPAQVDLPEPPPESAFDIQKIWAKTSRSKARSPTSPPSVTP